MDKIHKLKFSDNLRRQLAIHKKTQSDLSRYLNVSTATTSEWCTGKKMPRTDKIQSICKWLCIEMDELFKENQDNVPKTKLNLLKSDMIISEISERKYNERMEILKKIH